MKTNLLNVAAILFLILNTSCKKDNSANPSPADQDSFSVTVTGGYGSGRYKVNDTVHIFCGAISDNQVFSNWTGSDISILDKANEWHTWFIMPAKNVSWTSIVSSASAFSLKFEQIKGRDILKPVYYYFPSNPKGVVYLLHGTGGDAQHLASDYEWWLLIKDLVYNRYGVIISEAEESTKGVDINGDGNIRWNNSPWDVNTNVDFANLKIIGDTLEQRGYFTSATPKYSIGMSNGGNFSASLATIFNFKAGVSYCAPSGGPIAQSTNTPIQFCMAANDNNPNVGPQGNANALQNSQTISGRGICSRYLIKPRSPLYPERFARKGDISIAQSTAIFNELKKNGILDSKNYVIGYYDTFLNAYQSNKSAFPQISSLNLAPLQFVSAQVNLAVSDHHMYSDFNNSMIHFLNSQCN